MWPRQLYAASRILSPFLQKGILRIRRSGFPCPKTLPFGSPQALDSVMLVHKDRTAQNHMFPGSKHPKTPILGCTCAQNARGAYLWRVLA